MKHAGVVSAFNAGDRAAFGLDMQGAPLVDFVGPGDEWPAAWEANGGFGMLVEDGAPTQGDAAWAAQGLTNASFNGPNPRTIIGYRGEGTIFAASVDGRRPNAAGKSLDALAQWSGELGGEGVVNLDGGGSTTMWVDGLTPSGVINYPSDFGQAESTSHAGARAVGGAIFIHADPYNWPPRFQTQPPSTSTAVGELYLYDVDAIDLNVDDVVNYTLLDGPPAMSIDALTGALEYLAAPDDPALAFVTILAFDDQGGEAEQSFELIVEGGRGGDGDGDGDPGDGDGDGDGDSGGSGTGDSGTGGELGADELGAGEGCNCTTGARPRGRAGLLLVLGFGLGLGGARRRRARRD